jgi:hypothetical protein
MDGCFPRFQASLGRVQQRMSALLVLAVAIAGCSNLRHDKHVER